MNILLSLLLVVSVSLSIYFVDNGFNFFMVVPFGSLLLTLLLALIFSEKNQKTARLKEWGQAPFIYYNPRTPIGLIYFWTQGLKD